MWLRLLYTGFNGKRLELNSGRQTNKEEHYLPLYRLYQWSQILCKTNLLKIVFEVDGWGRERLRPFEKDISVNGDDLSKVSKC